MNTTVSSNSMATNSKGQQTPEAILNPTVLGQVPVSKEVIETKKAYFISGSNSTIVMPNGDRVVFQLGIVPGVAEPAFVTDVEGYIQYLDSQIAARHPVIHTVEGYETVTVEMLDPHAAVKKQAVLDYLASEEHKNMLKNLAGVGTPEASTSEQPTKLGGVGNTETIGATAAGSVGDAMGTTGLASLKK